MNILLDKKIIKLRSFSIAPLLFIILTNKLDKPVNENNINNYLNSDPYSVAEFISNNTKEFVDSYNLDSKEDVWKASYVEEITEISIVSYDYDYKGILLDFDDFNGYSIVGNNYSFLDFNISGENPLKNIKADSFVFYPLTSYYTYIKDGIEYSLEGECEKTLEDKADSTNYKQHYNGQDKTLNGNGGINDTNLYIKDKYGDGWRVKDRVSFIEMNKYSMKSLSCYTIDFGDYEQTESNCWAVAAYNCLQCIEKLQWIHNGIWLDIPAGDKDYRKSMKYYPADELWQYNAFNQKYDKVKINYWTYSNDWRVRFPDLWITMRKILNDEQYFIDDGGDAKDISSLVEKTASYYGVNIDSKENRSVRSFAADKGIQQIRNYMPLVFSTQDDTYGKHSVSVCGYKVYEKAVEHKIWFFGWHYWYINEQKLLYEICDGWSPFDYEELSSQSRYFDMSGYKGKGAINYFILE